jgi:hypothetical protein
VIIFELPKKTPEKPKYVMGVDNYTETTLLNKTETVDKNLLGHKKAVLSLCNQK